LVLTVTSAADDGSGRVTLRVFDSTTPVETTYVLNPEYCVPINMEGWAFPEVLEILRRDSDARPVSFFGSEDREDPDVAVVDRVLFVVLCYERARLDLAPADLAIAFVLVDRPTPNEVLGPHLRRSCGAAVLDPQPPQLPGSQLAQFLHLFVRPPQLPSSQACALTRA
jgi:hypothetical protein